MWMMWLRSLMSFVLLYSRGLIVGSNSDALNVLDMQALSAICVSGHGVPRPAL